MDFVRRTVYLLIGQPLTGILDILIQVAFMVISLFKLWNTAMFTGGSHKCRVYLDMLGIHTYSYMESNIQPSSIKTIWRITAHWSSFIKTIFFYIAFGDCFNDIFEESPFELSYSLYGQKSI